MTEIKTGLAESMNEQTVPTNSHKQEAMFIVNDFKNLFLYPDDAPENRKQEEKNREKNQNFGRILFHDLKKVNSSYFTKTQRWLGHVVEKNNDSFTAILKDLSNGGTEEYGEFDIDEITPDDLELLSIGAVFYMSIGYIFNNGTRKKESEIRFQRLIEFDEQEETDKGLDKVSQYYNHFK